MDKDNLKEISTLDFLKAKLSSKEKPKLTTDELIKFKQLKIEPATPFSPSIILFPFYGFFWISVFYLMFLFIWGIDLRASSLPLIQTLFKFWFPVVFGFILIAFLDMLNCNKMNRYLINKIIGERNEKGNKSRIKKSLS